MREPNGIVLSPDGETLYVGGNGTGRIYKWPVNPDGSVGARADFASLNGSGGATIDCAGNLSTVPATSTKRPSTTARCTCTHRPAPSSAPSPPG
ncbi:SMP-30/gluconolactonase/LRE family protein [Sphaerisporangium sp. NPDC005289]|uniref:SMP-30/gluconolactonase/LRE family protein n=1 Tax=Sphaerisporangium sp. NPDC005289 TaxID=3155247 RepID=UPI0033AFDDC8